MKILWLTNVPSPYRVDFFNELGKNCELTVGFEKSTSDERDISWKEYEFKYFEGVILPGRSIGTDTSICPKVIRLINRYHYDEIVVTNISSPTGIIAIEYLKLWHMPYWVEGDGGFATTAKGLKTLLKRQLFRNAKGYFSTGKGHDEYYLSYGVEKERIIRYPFTSLRFADLERARTMKINGKQYYRQIHGITECTIILSIGQFIHRKGFDLLLNAAQDLDRSIGIYIIGGKPTEELLELRHKLNLCNVHFINFQSKSVLAEFYYASDIFVLPTREDIWGLVVNEAMAYGLPVISTNRCGAALELVENGVNGFVLPVDDVDTLAVKLNFLCDNPEIREQFGRNSAERIRNYVIEEMVKRHISVFLSDR